MGPCWGRISSAGRGRIVASGNKHTTFVRRSTGTDRGGKGKKREGGKKKRGGGERKGRWKWAGGRVTAGRLENGTTGRSGKEPNLSALCPRTGGMLSARRGWKNVIYFVVIRDGEGREGGREGRGTIRYSVRMGTTRRTEATEEETMLDSQVTGQLELCTDTGIGKCQGVGVLFHRCK